MFSRSDRFASTDADIDLEAKDGRVAPKPRAIPAAFEPARRKIFLIHGYNVPGAEAVATISAFRECLTELAPELKADTFIVTWPGAWSAPVIAPVAYPYMIGNAQASAESLLTSLRLCLEDPDGPEEVVFVAHSLGCRLLIELLAELPSRSRRAQEFPATKRIVAITMAAAVPIDLGRRLTSALEAVDAFVVLHSRADKVLRFAFPLGQLIEAGFRRFTEAIGYAANPKGLPWEVAEMRGYDHGDYWSGHETALEICRVLAIQLLGIVVRWGRYRSSELPQHHLPSTGPLFAHRTVW